MTLSEPTSRALSREDAPPQGDGPDQPAASARDYWDALTAVLEAVDIPHAATVGEEQIRNRILLERVGHTVVMLSSVLDGEHPVPDVPWSAAYLRARLAEHPATGYKTWDERMAELDTLKAQDGGR